MDANSGEAQARRPGPVGRPPAGDRERATLGEVMALIAGLGFGLWLILPDLKESSSEFILIGASGVLGGLSFVGVPVLLLERLRRRRVGRWAPGRLMWFASGTSAWLLWPPIVIRRANGSTFGASSTGPCFAYGTPLMAVYVMLALLAGGWLGRRTRRRASRSWRERFGLLLGLAWACTGLYVLSLLYREVR